MLFMAFTLEEVVRALGAQRQEWAAKSSSEVLCRWGLTTGDFCSMLELPSRIAICLAVLVAIE